MADELFDLTHAVENARDWLDTAVRLASEMATDPDTGGPNGWKEMDAVAGKLDAGYKSLAGILDPLADAIKTAEAHADHMSDLADGRSY